MYLLTFLGAGQGGLTIAARLKMLGVTSLIVDRAARVGTFPLPCVGQFLV